MPSVHQTRWLRRTRDMRVWEEPARRTEPPYRHLFAEALTRDVRTEIRTATNGRFAFGDERFQREIAAMLGRRTWCGRPGRPRAAERDAGQIEVLIEGRTYAGVSSRDGRGGGRGMPMVLWKSCPFFLAGVRAYGPITDARSVDRSRRCSETCRPHIEPTPQGWAAPRPRPGAAAWGFDLCHRGGLGFPTGGSACPHSARPARGAPSRFLVKSPVRGMRST
jgi:hypothetical protein